MSEGYACGGWLVLLCVLWYFMFITRNIALRVIGWVTTAAFLFLRFPLSVDGSRIGLVLVFILLCLISLSKSKKAVVRRGTTVLVLFMFVIVVAVIIAFLTPESELDASMAGHVIRDLRSLKSAAQMFYSDHEAWPSPGQEASLDAYCERPIANENPSRYASVTLDERPFGEVGSVDRYVGVELLPKRNGAREVQRILARKAKDSGIFQEPTSGGGELVPYESGLSVYMKIN
jgi:hypothetical protein